jgi:nicotinamide-nucleotide amidase
VAGVTPLRRAAIVAVGSELLTPLKIDTNSLFITEQLNLLGVDVVSKAVVGDDRAELGSVVRALLPRVDLLILSGGLGPTDDDVTREVVASVLGRALKEDETLTERIRERFRARGFVPPMPEINRRQAMVPAGARTLDNANGSAPGLWIDDGERVVLLLPGPPRELKPMLTALVAGALRERTSGSPLIRRVLKMANRIESQTEEVLQPLYREWEQATPRISATILAALGQIELHLWTSDPSRDVAERALDEAVQRAVAAIGPDVYSTDGRAIEEVVGELLAASGLRIAIAESCTGGLITSRLTDVPGSSRYVIEGVITYANEAKTTRLGVPERMLADGQRAGGARDGRRRAIAGGHRDRRGGDGHRRTRRRHPGETGRHRGDSRRHAVCRTVSRVPFSGRTRQRQIPGVAGSPGHGAAPGPGSSGRAVRVRAEIARAAVRRDRDRSDNCRRGRLARRRAEEARRATRAGIEDYLDPSRAAPPDGPVHRQHRRRAGGGD